MKKIFVFIVLIIATISCNKLKEPDHSIRIANKTYNALSSTKIGSVTYGTINPSKTTDYKPVQEGSHDFLSYTTNYYYSGSVSVQQGFLQSINTLKNTFAKFSTIAT